MTPLNQVGQGDYDYRREIARRLLEQGIDASPIQSWTQGAARLAQTLAGTLIGNKLQQEQIAAMQYNPLTAPGGSADASPASAPPMGNKIAEALSQPSVTPPVMPVEGGGTVPTPPPRPVFNRTAYTDEANDPTMAQRLATIVQGEVGRGATPAQQQVQLETILNRAAARNQPLSEVTKMYTGPGSPGYYPQSTFTNGSATPDQAAAFKQNILTPVLRGSDVSTATLGFPATGNASGSVASNGINNGRYTQYANIGPETYVQEGKTGPENINRLMATRLAQSDSMIPPNAQPTAQAGQPPMQVAQAQPTPDMLNQIERNVDRTLSDPNTPFAVKQKAYQYKQLILQKRLEQSLKYGPDAIAGEAAKAGAVEQAKNRVTFSPEGIAGAARLEGAKEEAALPAKAVLKGSPTFEDKQKLEQKDRALGTLSDTVSGIAKNYVALDKMGAIPNSDKGVMANLSARTQSSAAGQEMGQAVGAKSASIRQEILNSRPQLINAIRQATQMGARGLDSNVELSFYMQQTSDPTRDVWSNLAALDKLDRAYGLGGSLKKVLTPEQYARVERGSAALEHEFKASQGGSDPLGIR